MRNLRGGALTLRLTSPLRNGKRAERYLCERHQHPMCDDGLVNLSMEKGGEHVKTRSIRLMPEADAQEFEKFVVGELFPAFQQAFDGL